MKVAMVIATTLCGRIGPAGFGSSEDRKFLEELRSSTGASLMGAGTLRVENPEMRGAGGRISQDRIRSFISFSGVIPVAGKKVFMKGPPPVLFTGDDNRSRLEKEMGKKARVLALSSGPNGLSIRQAVNRLEELGADSVLIEGGGKLNYAAFAEKIVDEIFLTLAPRISGDATAPMFIEGGKPLGHPFLSLDLLSCRESGFGEMFLHYRINRGDAHD